MTNKALFPAAAYPLPDKVDPLLVDILRYPRGNDSVMEAKFTHDFFEPALSNLATAAGGTSTALMAKPQFGQFGSTHNVHARASVCAWKVDVPRSDGTVNDVLFSSHIDTVGDYNAKDFKSLTYLQDFGQVELDKTSVGGCLGADDGAGVWLMMKMIEAKVPGVYLFHRGEESGGIGSRAVLAEHATVLKDINLAVAFDRKGDTDVVLTQGGLRCASDKLGQAVVTALNKHGLSLSVSHNGSFTDTKVYRGVVAECINISCGYDDNHSIRETLDFAYLSALLKAVCAVDWTSMPIDRDPKAVDPTPVPRWSRFQGGYCDEADAFWFSGHGTPTTPEPKRKQSVRKALSPAKEASASDTLSGFTLDGIEAFATKQPAKAAALIAALYRENARLKADVRTLTALLGA